MEHVSVRRDERAVAPVIAEILLVAISVTISGLVYFTANSFTTQTTGMDRPFVSLMSPSIEDGIARVTVAAASRPVSPTSYRVNLQADGTLGRPVPLPAAGTGAILPMGGVDYRVSWSDPGNGGALVGGDTITITAAGGPLPAHTEYAFYLIWSDGAVLQSVSWNT